MLFCSRWVAWSVPLRANSRNAVNWHSRRFIDEEFVGLQAIPALLAAAQLPDALVFPGGKVRAEVVADDRDPYLRRVQAAHVAQNCRNSAPYDLSIGAAGPAARFASPLPRSDEPSARQVRRAIATAIGAHCVRSCAARVGQAHGEHPETALTGCAGRSRRWPAPSAVHRQRRPTPAHLATPP